MEKLLTDPELNCMLLQGLRNILDGDNFNFNGIEGYQELIGWDQLLLRRFSSA